MDSFSFAPLSVRRLNEPATIIATGTASPRDLTIIGPLDPHQGVTVAILLDSTGSMTTNDPQRIRVEAGKKLVTILDDGDEAAVGDFRTGGQPTPGYRYLRLLQDFTSDHSLLNAALERVLADGGTPFYDAMLDGIDLLLEHHAGNPAIVALTDGQENSSTEGTFTSVVQTAYAADIPVFPIGLGADVDFTELQRLAEETGGTFASALDAAELEQLFENMGVAVTAGRVVLEADLAFSPALPSSGVFTITGLLWTEVGGVVHESPFSFQVELGPRESAGSRARLDQR